MRSDFVIFIFVCAGVTAPGNDLRSPPTVEDARGTTLAVSARFRQSVYLL
jgi:hypothetical protein